MGEQLTSEAEILFRQIHPSFLEGGHPSSQPFQPTKKDENNLSVDRSTIVTAKVSFELYTKSGHQSVAVYGISVKEFVESELPCFSDPLDGVGDQLPNPAHAYADFSKHSPNKQKTLAKRLKIKAMARGCLHPLNPNEASHE